jgi:hypothetical protein
LQRFGHLPNDETVFKSYAVEGNFSDVRLAALEALVDFTAGEFLCVAVYVFVVLHLVCLLSVITLLNAIMHS